MAQVAVGEGVGGGLEPDDDGVDFGEGADEGVVDVVVYDDGGDEEAEGRVEPVQPGDQLPGRVELLALCFGGSGCLGAGAGVACCELAFGVFGRDELDNVGREEVAGDYEEEGGADEDVVAFVVMAS